MTIEELSKQVDTMRTDFETSKKTFEVKLEAAQRDSEQWRTVAMKAQEDARVAGEKVKAAEKTASEAAAKARIESIRSFVDQAKKEGKISPASADLAVKLAESMTSETEIAKFEKADGSTTTHTQLSLFKAFVQSLGKTNIFREMTGTSMQRVESPGNGEDATFAEVQYGGTKKRLPVAGNDVHARAVAFQDQERAAGRNVSYEQALIAVSPREAV